MSLLIEDEAVVLFQGDSITDAGRSKTDESSMGGGYANMAAAWLSATYPGKRVRFLNRGVGGHRVAGLQGRWRRDCIALKPTWVSIMIGINDTWHGVEENRSTPMEEYEASFRDILEQTSQATRAKIIICEPFVLPTPADRLLWRVDLDPRINLCRRLAQEFADAYVPLDGLFAQACLEREPEFWAPDGVHPTQAGHALIAQAWLRAVGAL